MRLRHWLATGISLGFLLGFSSLAAAAAAPATAQPAPAAQPAPQLPEACTAAGVKTEADCQAFIAKSKAAAEKTAADKAAADQAAAAKAAADKAAHDKAAADKLAADKAAADKLAAEKAAAGTASAAKAAADKAALDKAAADKAAAAKAAASAGAAADKAALDKAAADKVAAAKVAAEKAAAEKAAAEKAAAAATATPATEATSPAAQNGGSPAQGLHLPKDCIAAGAKTEEECKAFRAANGKPARTGTAPTAAAATETTTPAATETPTTEVTKPGPKSAVTGQTPAATTTTAAPAATGETATPAPTGTGKPQGLHLPKLCTEAGLTTKADCDALVAIKGQKGKPGGNQPAAEATTPVTTAPATGTTPAVTAEPAAPAGPLPAEVTPAKPQAEQKPAAEPKPQAPALPDITEGLNTAAKSYNQAAMALDSAGGDPAAADKARADIKAQQARIDALCRTNRFDSTARCLAQYGVVLAPVAAAGAPGGKPIVVQQIQPVEVINNLPKGVSKQDVAPLLDSAKDNEAGQPGTGGKPGRHGKPGQGQPQDQTRQGQVQQPITTAPPPTTDKGAQADIQPGAIKPIDQSQGQQIDPNAANTPQVGVPQDATIINQTTLDNTTTTGVQNNNGGTPGDQNNGRLGFGNGQHGNGPGRHGNGPGNGNPGFPGQQAGTPNPIGLGLGIILQLGNQLIINSPGRDQHRIADSDDDHTQYDRLPGNRYRETITRPNGVRIVTIYNKNGDILRRSRFDRDGHETVLAYFDDRFDDDLANWRDPGQDLPPLQLHIPARDYVLDADQADEGQVQDFFAQPPVEQVQRLYSIDEVKRSARIRDMVRRLELGDLTFDTGAATISEDQVGNLSKVAQAMLDLLDKNPAETFLIEGHTDAVGSDISNLQLSDARAATVARILTDFYHIPPENLATQGYGERFLKVQTDGPEPLNRRVTIRRITPLVTVASQDD